MVRAAEGAVRAPGRHARSSGRTRLLFRNRDYTGWWIGETVSDFGTALSTVAYPLLVLVVTGSAAGAGVVGAAVNIGGLVTMLFGGALGDRFSRRTLLIAAPLVQAVAVGAVVAAVLTGQVTVADVGVVGFVQGMASGLAGGAEFAALRRLVPQEQLPAAFAQFEGRAMTIRLVGPAAGGFLFGIAQWVPFLGDALSFLASAAGVLLIRRPLGPDLAERGPRESIFASIGIGLRYIRGNAYLRFMTAWVAFANACVAGLLLLVIVLVHSHHGSSALVGSVTSIGAVGGLAGAVVSGRIARRAPGRLVVIVVSWMTAAVAAGIGIVPDPWMVGLLLALMLFLVSPLNVIFSTYEAQMIPDELTSAVSSTINFGAGSIRWLGVSGAGFLASAFGPATAALVFAGVLAAVALSTHVASGLHALDRPVVLPIKAA
jgi:MFS family permease